MFVVHALLLTIPWVSSGTYRCTVDRNISIALIKCCMVAQLTSWLPQGDKEDREKMRAMDAEKVRQEKAQRKADEALMEPARLAARGLSLEQIETDMKRRGMAYDRDYLIRQIEKADRKRAAEEDDPFYAVNTEVVNFTCLCICWFV